MEDFNRISYVVKNSAYLRGLLFLPICFLFTYQMLTTNRVFNFYNDNLLLSLFGYLLPPVGLFALIGILYYFYVKSIGGVTNYPNALNSERMGKFLIIALIYCVIGTIGILNSNLTFMPGLFLAFAALVIPDFKENLKYRKYVFGIAAVTFLAGILPLERVFTFGNHLEQPITNTYLSMITFGILTAVCNHFALLKMLRPLRPESYQNSSASQDAILGDPSNLTILAALANCQNADFVFLQKISQLDEANFNKQVYYMEQAGLLYVFQLPNGIFKNKLAAKISPLGWQVVTRIYNETMAAPTQPNQALAY